MAVPSTGPRQALYYSRARATLLPRSIGFTIIAFGVLFIALSLTQRRLDFLLLPLIAFPLGSFVGFMTATVKVDEHSVVIAFCDIFKRTLRRDEIATVTTDNAAGPSGYGVRYMGPGTVGYLVGGPEINIQMKSGKTVIASTNRPEQLIRILTEAES
ncbi:hypothetical protein [Paenarthrobacter sp. CAP02]|jgi:hypothetical protein|uniref:hypothetical protein n=1 Tax=Paenarthrobacter sp. CAP02 TaxID=3158144 RepID=UPI0032DAAF71